MDTARARTLAAAGRHVEARLAPEALASQLLESSAGTRGESDALRDVAQLRKLLASAGVVALFDAPWVPVYLLIITVLHPLLGGIAALGAVLLFGLGVVTERVTRRRTERALAASRAAQRNADALLRNAETGGRHGNDTGCARRLAGTLRRATRGAGKPGGGEHPARRPGTHGAPAPADDRARVWRLAGVGRQASPGIMIAATILLGRALQPVETADQRMEGHDRGAQRLVTARGARRPRASRAAAIARAAWPSRGRQAHLLVFGTARPLLRGVSLTAFRR
jgi:hypothetical protein